MHLASIVRPWWARILLFIAAFAISGFSVAFVVPRQVAGEFGGVILYVVLFVVSFGFERIRGGGIVTFGTPLHRRLWSDLGRGSMMAIGALAVVILASVSLGASFTLAMGPWTVTIISALMSTIVLAWGEEVLFRGIIFQAFEERFNGAVAIVVTSVPFGLVHMANPGASTLSVVNTIMAGVVLGAMASHYRSLWPSIGFHIVWNLSLGLFIGPISGYSNIPYQVTMLDTTMLGDLRWLVDGVYGVEQGAIATIVMVGVTILIYRSDRYDAVVAAARIRLRLREDAVSYTGSDVASSPSPHTSTTDH